MEYLTSNSDERILSDDDYYCNRTGVKCSTFEEFCLHYSQTDCGCSNYSEADKIECFRHFSTPTGPEWVLVGIHAIVFLAGIIGNSLVCIAVFRNPAMKTVTNILIVNLAVADLLVIVFCLPATVAWDVTSTWFLGQVLCKVLTYLQNVSVSVSVLTLTWISIDRCYAICQPLRFKSTLSRTWKAIFFIWTVSLLLAFPDLVYLETTHKTRDDTVFWTQCEPHWDFIHEITYQGIRVVALYLLPLGFMSYAYLAIIQVLWNKSIYQHEGRNSESSVTSFSGCYRSGSENHLAVRRNAAKMLIVVVAMFAVCYFPCHVLSVLRQTIGLPDNEYTIFWSLMSHWLVYFNSAVNPVIYNFMSRKFRDEFRVTTARMCLGHSKTADCALCSRGKVKIYRPVFIERTL